jgi:hypothetical protein
MARIGPLERTGVRRPDFARSRRPKAKAMMGRKGLRAKTKLNGLWRRLSHRNLETSLYIPAQTRIQRTAGMIMTMPQSLPTTALP